MIFVAFDVIFQSFDFQQIKKQRGSYYEIRIEKIKKQTTVGTFLHSFDWFYCREPS